MGTHNHGNIVGSGIDRPHKAGLATRVMETVMPVAEPQTAKDEAEDAQESAKARRIEQEKSAFDLDHKPTERDAQIDGSGARFETDG